jgi:ABC-type Mn2+/Zn2+ transport system ATPase subunit
MIITQDFYIYGSKKHKLCGPLNFTVNENVITLIQGINGAGKSSFLKYLVNGSGSHKGELKLKNTNLKFSYLPQHYTNDFQYPATLNDILQAFKVKTKYLSETLSPNLTWRTCSGGEKQRILLDIVLNRKADILLLDEPTNNLDEESKNILWKSLQTSIDTKKFRAVVVVSHENPSFLQYEKVTLT